MLNGFVGRCKQKALSVSDTKATEASSQELGLRHARPNDPSLNLSITYHHDSSNRHNGAELSESQLEVLDEVLEDRKNVEKTLRQIARLTVAIRKSGSHSKLQKADNSFQHGDHTELKEHLEIVILARPSEDGRQAFLLNTDQLDPIQLRLVEANLRRRNRFLYAQRHSQKLAEIRETHDEKHSGSCDLGVSRRQNSNLDEPNKQSASQRDARQHDDKIPMIRDAQPPNALTATSASAVVGPIQLPTKESSQPSMTVISSTSAKIIYPRPPPINANQSIFKCPCCCRALPTYFSKGTKWRKHLMGDMFPYTCIAPDCPSPWNLYATRETWMKHMEAEHTSAQFWVCFACRDREKFHERNAFISHLQTKHQGISADQIPTFLSACSRFMPIEIRSCPLCPQEAPDDPNRLLDHVAEHVHSFSLRSLPWAPSDNLSDDSSPQTGRNEDNYFLDNEYFGGDSEHTSSGNTVSSGIDDRDSEGLPELNFEDDDDIPQKADEDEQLSDVNSAFDVGEESRPPSILSGDEREASVRELQGLLAFPTIFWVEEAISSPTPGTCSWILEHENYTSWLTSHDVTGSDRFLCVQGCPGAGKSTMMKYLREATALNQRQGSAVVLPFFCTEGYTEISLKLLRALLYHAIPHSSNSLVDMIDTIEFYSNTDGWNEETLLDYLTSCLSDTLQLMPVFIFVGLEQQNQTKDVVNILQTLLRIQSPTPLRICFSTPDTLFDFGIRAVPFPIRMEDHTHQDIRITLESLLEQIVPGQMSDFIQIVISKANGCFLWARLLAESILRENEKSLGKIIPEVDCLRKIEARMIEKVQQAPGELEGLYRAIMDGSIGLKKPSKELLRYGFLLKSYLEVGFLEFLSAEDIGTAEELPREPVTDDCIRSLTVGLAKVEYHQSFDFSIITFVHPTVLDYFHRGGLEDLDDGHWHIAKSCLRRLSNRNVQQSLLQMQHDGKEDFGELFRKYPFLGYAFEWPYHARLAEGSLKSFRDFAELLDQSLIDCWIRLHQRYTPERFSFDGASVFHVLAYYGLTKILQAVIDKDMNQNLDVTDSFGRTALFYAASEGSTTVAELFLAQESVYPNVLDQSGMSPLSHAAMRGHNPIVELLLMRDDVDPNLSDKSGSTPLSLAIKRGDETMVKLLLARSDVSVNTADSKGITPIMEAVICQDWPSVEMLLSRPELDVTLPDHKGLTVLHHAVIGGNDRVVEMLLERDADPSHVDERGWTPLFYAAREGHSGVAQRLLHRKDLAPDISDATGRTALSYAASNKSFVAVEQLLEIRDLNPNKPDDLGRTPLMFAALDGSESTVQMLCQREGVEVNQRDSRGETALFFAIMSGDASKVSALIKAGADVNATDNDGQSPSMLAEKRWNPEIQHLLLLAGADPYAGDTTDTSKLFHTIRRGDIEVMRSLLSSGTDPNATESKYGRPSLSVAIGCRSLRTEIVQELLRAGADPNFEAALGWVPLLEAVFVQRTDILSLLLDYGADPEVLSRTSHSTLAAATWMHADDLVEKLLSIHEFSIEQLEEAHKLANLNDYTVIVQLLTQKMDPESSLRSKQEENPGS